MVTRFQGVAFDLEGTLINGEPAHHNGWVRAAKDFGVSITIEEALEKCPHFIGGPDKEIIDEIFALHPDITRPDDKKFLARKWVHYNELLQELDLSPRAGSLDVIQAFQAMRLPTSIGSSVDMDQVKVLLDRSGLRDHFKPDLIVLSADFFKTKPAPDCFLETARRMKIDPRYQLVFEDSARGVQSGVAAKSKVVGVPVYNLDKTKQQLWDSGVIALFTDWRDINIKALLRHAEDFIS